MRGETKGKNRKKLPKKVMIWLKTCFWTWNSWKSKKQVKLLKVATWSHFQDSKFMIWLKHPWFFLPSQNIWTLMSCSCTELQTSTIWNQWDWSKSGVFWVPRNIFDKKDHLCVCFAVQSDCDFFYQIILSFRNPKKSRSWTSWPHYNKPPLKIRPSSNDFTFIYKSRLHHKVQILWEDHKIWKSRSPFYKLLKGQLISKCIFGVSQKTNKTIQLEVT